jgi:hypothetical protein
MIHWKILDAKRKTILEKLCAEPWIKDFYLAGGTALSLELGLRKSNDFDFFSSRPFGEEKLFADLTRALGKKPQVISLGEGTCDVNADGIQISFFYYPHPLLEDTVISAELPGLQMASLDDIAAMKMAAIGSRSVKKDFYDLYHILTLKNYQASDLIRLLNKKFGKKGWGASYYVMSLSYFDPAEADSLPQCYVPCDWSKIKTYFLAFQKAMLAALSLSDTETHID